MDCIGSWVRNQIWRYRSHWRRLGWLWWKGMLAENHSYNGPYPHTNLMTSRLENQWASQTLRATSAKRNNAMSLGGSLISYILVTFFFLWDVKRGCIMLLDRYSMDWVGIRNSEKHHTGSCVNWLVPVKEGNIYVNKPKKSPQPFGV